MAKSLDFITKNIEKYLGLHPNFQSQLFYTLLILIGLWMFRKLILKFFVDKVENYKDRYTWTKTIKTITLVLALILLSRVWFGFFESVGTFLGLLSAGLAIAFKDLLVNLGGWLFILLRKPFKIGDRIQIDNVTGDVIDMRLFQFSVIEVGNWVDADQSTGRVINIPNGYVFTKWQANYTSIRDSGVLLTMRYICHARKRRTTHENILEEILEQFAKYDNIDFAYPTTRFYDNLTEGKQAKK